MFDLGWQEFMLIALIAVVVVGPKDLPKVIRTVSQWVRKARSLASEFHGSLEEMAREADLEEIRNTVEDAKSGNWSETLKSQLDPDGELEDSFKEAKSTVEDAKKEGDEAKATLEDDPKIEQPVAEEPDENETLDQVEEQFSAAMDNKTSSATAADAAKDKDSVTGEKPAKTPAKKAGSRKTSTRKPAAAKTAGAKTGDSVTAAKKPTTRKTAAKKPTAAKASSNEKAAAPKTSTRKTTTRNTSAKSTSTSNGTGKTTTRKRAPAKSPAKTAPKSDSTASDAAETAAKEA